MKIIKAKLQKVETIAQNTKYFLFLLPMDFKFQAGNFVSVKVGEKDFRAYSIASASDILPQIELIIKLVPNGLGSGYFDKLQVGDEIELMGPFGHFVLPNNQRDKIFIATGAGITPMRSFWRTIMMQKLSHKMHLFFGFRHEENAFLLDEIEQVPNMSSEIAVSQPKEKDCCPCRVSHLLREKDVEFFQDKDVFICGSSAMTTEIQKILLEEKRMPKEQVFFESFS